MRTIHATALLMICLSVFSPFAIAETIHEVIYTSQNLEGHVVNAECNPGGGTNCPCSQDDVAIYSYDSYGEVVSNPFLRNTWVNAIGGKRFMETFPDGAPVALGVYRYKGEFRIPTLPAPDPNQQENANGVLALLQFWDGRDELVQLNKTSLEGTFLWSLNPWDPSYGKIMVYTNPVTLVETGIVVNPDTAWHSFEMTVDFVTQRYVSIDIDGEWIDLSGLDLARIHRPEWGDEVGIVITTESIATWPFYDCSAGAFSWTTQFRNIEFERLIAE